METSKKLRFSWCGRGVGWCLWLVITLSGIGIDAARAQSGSVAGRVIDETSGEPLTGAAVLLPGTAIGTATDLDGRFLLSGLPAGEQMLQVRYLGYVTQDAPVTVQEGTTVEVVIEMAPDVLEGSEVIITAQAEGQAQAINQQLQSNTIVNVVSAARIQELPDANAAESVGRLPGISIVRDAGEGAKVTVRGLAPKFSAITVDGDKIPSTDLDDRSVDLAMISPEMLAGIEVYKALRPDMDADAIGGMVNFRTSGAPDTRRVSLTLQSGYHQQIQDVGSYRISGTASERFFRNRLGSIATASFHRADRSSDVLSASYEVPRAARDGETHAPIHIRNLQLVDRLETRDRYGFGLNLDFTIPGGRIYLNNFGNRLVRDEMRWTRTYSVTNMRQEWQMLDRDIQVDQLTSRLSGEHRILGTNLDWRLSRSISKRTHPYDHEVLFHEPSGMIDSRIDLTQGPTQLPFAARNNINETQIWQDEFNTTGALERDLLAQFDWTIPARIGRQLAGNFKFGAKHFSKYRNRSDDARWQAEFWEFAPVWESQPDQEWTFNAGGQLNMENFIDPGYSSDGFLENQYEMLWGPNRDKLSTLWENFQDIHSPDYEVEFDEHRATERISAVYAMTEWTLGRRVMIMPGVRYEYEHSEYSAKEGVEPNEDVLEEDLGFYMRDTSAARNMGQLFPMVHARLFVTDWFDIRVARTLSASRPDYAMVSPQSSISPNSRAVRRGNTQIKPTLSTNYDAFFSFHGNRLGLLTLGAFYKDIEGLIYYLDAVVLDPEALGLGPTTRGYSIREPVNNPNNTTVRGFEVEWQSNLLWLPVPLNGLVINANYSRIFSETQYPFTILERGPQGFVQTDTFYVGPMVLQPAHVANISLGYDLGGFSGRVSMLYQGKTLRGAVGARREEDRYTKDYLRFDASFRYDITRALRVMLNVQNLTNRPDLSTQYSDFYPVDQEYYGWSMDLGLGYRF